MQLASELSRVAVQWHYVPYPGARQQGPVGGRQLGRLLQLQRLRPVGFVWREGMSDWTSPQHVPELARFLPGPQRTQPKGPTVHGLHPPDCSEYGLSRDTYQRATERKEMQERSLFFPILALGGIGVPGGPPGILAGVALGMGYVLVREAYHALRAPGRLLTAADLYEKAARDYRAAAAQQREEFEAQQRRTLLRQRQAEKDARALELEFWRGLDGPGFERQVAALFRHLGYTVKQCGGPGDGGIDLFIDDVPAQCKAHNRPMGPSVVRELRGAMAHVEASRALDYTAWMLEVRTEVRKRKPHSYLDGRQPHLTLQEESGFAPRQPPSCMRATTAASVVDRPRMIRRPPLPLRGL